ncbi:hypothetical protein KJS94_12515 [Flavihumibacter rivuli]|uniref:hypothetical protein n=1 Tax=Flavihumibacter rivuli TaxID=2838156 RepID=UPI001BDE93E4|nr:hypothetical protein [Flavihumibacter rivuli]ULQ55466.1 hypothetical protein KJS94_12515 [Flavihumibacter rivuli]
MSKPSFRMLRGYSLDPGFSIQLNTAQINEITYAIRWEEIGKGPVGEYFEVIDIDPASNCWYEPVDLDSIEVLAQNGLPPSEGNPKFHQQFVYTISMKTLEHFEHSLGRKILWRPRNYNPKLIHGGKGAEFVRRLRIYPHAFRGANAYYDPEKKAILFGYFEAPKDSYYNGLPGGAIFACLSPDIVAHELTHALLDSIHPRFIEDTNPDVGGFHEGFADIVALLQRFTITNLVEHQIAETKGNLSEFSYLGELATQFGNALDNSRGALRGAIGAINPKTNKWERFKPDPLKYKKSTEPHDRGAILVATIFDAFLRLYHWQTADLLRIASNGTGVLQKGAIHPDLVKRLAAEACSIAKHLLYICIRALDYCPPVDITYGDYLRALITADLDSSPQDKNGYRLALIEAFKAWGIYPDRVNTLSVESLKWAKSGFRLGEKDNDMWREIVNTLKPQIRELVDIGIKEPSDRELLYTKTLEIQAAFYRLLMQGSWTKDPLEWGKILQNHGLTNKTLEFIYNDEVIKSNEVPKIQVHKVRPAYRVGRDGTIQEQVLITLVQTFRITTGSLSGEIFRGGCTVVINMSKNYEIEYVILKNIESSYRFAKQMNYQTGNSEDFSFASDDTYAQEQQSPKINFEKLHFHSH